MTSTVFCCFSEIYVILVQLLMYIIELFVQPLFFFFMSLFFIRLFWSCDNILWYPFPLGLRLLRLELLACFLAELRCPWLNLSSSVSIENINYLMEEVVDNI